MAGQGEEQRQIEWHLRTNMLETQGPGGSPGRAAQGGMPQGEKGSLAARLVDFKLRAENHHCEAGNSSFGSQGSAEQGSLF